MGISIFLADDHVILRDGVRLLVETQSDMQVVGTAANGREAVEMVAGCRPDIVIMDIAMPEMDGIEATRQIRANCPFVQVIVLSMYATYEYVMRAFRAGARGYLLKDSAGIEVVEAIRAIHVGQTYISRKLASLTAPGGLLAVSGIFQDNYPSLRRRFRVPGLRCVKTVRRGKWYAVLYRRDRGRQGRL